MADELVVAAVVIAITGVMALVVGTPAPLLTWVSAARPGRWPWVFSSIVLGALLLRVGGSPMQVFGEELVFRVAPLMVLSSRRSSIGAVTLVVVISAGAFALAHDVAWTLATVDRLLFGVVLFVLLLQWGHVWVAVLVHLVTNTMWRTLPALTAGEAAGYIVDAAIVTLCLAAVVYRDWRSKTWSREMNAVVGSPVKRRERSA